MLKKILRWLLAHLYKVKIVGWENLEHAGDRVLIVANHTSFLDPVLLWAFLPDDVTFAINTQVAELFWVKPALRFARVFTMDPSKPMSVKALTHFLKDRHRAVLFPEGRITTTGALMKVYDGAAMIADKAGAQVLPLRVDGAQYSPFSRLRGVVRVRWFPSITLNLLPPRKLALPQDIQGDERRERLGTQLQDVMCEMVFATGNIRRTLFSALLEARAIHGGRWLILEDMQRRPISYNGLITRVFALADKLAELAGEGEAIGLLLPNAIATVATILALQLRRRVPAMLNYSVGPVNMLSACRTAELRTVVTSRRFVELAKLEAIIEQMQSAVRVVYLEDLAAALSWRDKGLAMLKAHTVRATDDGVDADRPAVILFTSGSEGVPKGVALSHANLLANREQVLAKIDLAAHDRVLNVLPLFHTFGFVGVLLPMLSGMRNFLYPSPLHYRIIPEVAYDINATILFGSNTFLASYAKNAHPYDFYSVRYVFAGAEKLQAETRRLWSDKFGIRILEAYGVTETSPGIAVNTPMHYRAGSVGRLLPGIEYRLQPVEGMSKGGRLHVRGPNVMLGYLLPENPGKLAAPTSIYGEGWHDTGDLVEIDAEGFLFILGRFKRFAKIGGEMVSLAAVEELAARLWPEALHAAIAVPDARKGERILLATDFPHAQRDQLLEHARREGFSELFLPKEINVVASMPLLTSGKIDYPAVSELLLGPADKQ